MRLVHRQDAVAFSFTDRDAAPSRTISSGHCASVLTCYVFGSLKTSLALFVGTVWGTLFYRAVNGAGQLRAQTLETI